MSSSLHSSRMGSCSCGSRRVRPPRGRLALRALVHHRQDERRLVQVLELLFGDGQRDRARAGVRQAFGISTSTSPTRTSADANAALLTRVEPGGATSRSSRASCNTTRGRRTISRTRRAARVAGPRFRRRRRRRRWLSRACLQPRQPRARSRACGTWACARSRYLLARAIPAREAHRTRGRLVGAAEREERRSRHRRVGAKKCWRLGAKKMPECQLSRSRPVSRRLGGSRAAQARRRCFECRARVSPSACMRPTLATHAVPFAFLVPRASASTSPSRSGGRISARRERRVF